VPTTRGPFAALAAGPVDAHPPVVLIVAGWTGSKEDFQTLLPEVARGGRRVVAIDQRGQFETPGPDDPDAYTLDALAADLLAVAAALSDAPVDLLGHSLGGLVAATAALAQPQAVNSLVMLCSGPGALPAQRHPLLHALERVLFDNGLEAAWRSLRSYDEQVGTAGVPSEIEEWMHRRYLAANRTAMLARTSLLRTAPRVAGPLGDVPVPLLVLSGELDDGWPVQEQAVLAAEARAEHQVMPGVGHSPAVEDPTATAQRLQEFWDRWQPRPLLSLSLSHDTSSVPRARRAVRRALDSLLAGRDLDDAELLTSELVSNALVHATAPVELGCAQRGAMVEIVVSDSGPGARSATGDAGLRRDHHGRGLTIVERVAHRCGWRAGPSGTSVWCWLPVSRPSAGSGWTHGAAAGASA
jgi:pimeloyl-ACP methyl ester carboxylesterase/anti-sigma regulatory factor (Ser/Thr protein kinase)